MLKRTLKKLIPTDLLLQYHRGLAILGELLYGCPSKKMVIIGVTGTKGKTSTANFIWAALNSATAKCGLISTANLKIGSREEMNKYHMTMPGRFEIAKNLARMVKEGCQYAVVETTSEGIKQFRHKAIAYDICVFTNLTPEHLPSHGGSFEKYRQAKGKLFRTLEKHHKKIAGQNIKSAIIVNADNDQAAYFLNFEADKKITYAIRNEADLQATDIKEEPGGVSFKIKAGQPEFKLKIVGGFNVYNALPAIAVGRDLGLNDDLIAKRLARLNLIPGRMEEINEGQDFKIFVDYAHEKISIGYVLDAGNKMKDGNGRVIILLGAEGGGRDKAKRPIMGELAAERANYVIVSNVDPYADEPGPIIEDIARSAEQHGKIRGKNLFAIEDRRLGINKALSLARKGDVVIITGKGAEQSIIIGGKSIAWDDRAVVRQELNKVLRV